MAPDRSVTVTVHGNADDSCAEANRPADLAEHHGPVELRQPGGRDAPRQLGQQRVRARSWTLRRPRVTVTGDRTQRHGTASTET